MALRLLQVTAPADLDLDDLVTPRHLVGEWKDAREEGFRVLHLAVPAEKTEALMDELEDRCSENEGFRVVLLEIEALLPRPKKEEEAEKDAEEESDASDSDAENQVDKPAESRRISREELHADVTEGLDVSPIFLSMTALSSLVASVGLLRDDLAVIIGAMVIAPLLRPNVALALSTTLADRELAWRALKTNLAGVLLAVAIAAVLGLLVPVDPDIPALRTRTEMDIGTLVLALAAGAAGTLAFTQGLSGAVIGVMVAVALLPPAAAFGLLLGAGHFQPALHAFLLTAGNVICINLAGVGTFLAQGIRPRRWWEAERARKASLAAVGIWLLLLVALVTVLWASGNLEILIDPRKAIQ